MAAPKGVVYNVDGLGGRPKKYTEDFINEQADKLIAWFNESPNNIYFEEFTLSQGINPNRMSEWADCNDKFSVALQIGQRIQELRLKKGATFKELDCNFTKFILINNHGYKDKTEATINGDILDPFANVLAKIMDSSRGLKVDGKE